MGGLPFNETAGCRCRARGLDALVCSTAWVKPHPPQSPQAVSFLLVAATTPWSVGMHRNRWKEMEGGEGGGVGVHLVEDPYLAARGAEAQLVQKRRQCTAGEGAHPEAGSRLASQACIVLVSKDYLCKLCHV